MPELYDNDWQPGKADYRLWSMQHEAMNYYSMQQRIFAVDPNYHYGAIIWDGAIASSVWRSRIATSIPFYYISRGQKWDFDRYEGWAQFTLWTTRPREFREFRGFTGGDHLYFETAFDAVVRAVDRPWNHEVLREFWRFGTLVPNPEGGHPWTLSDGQPDWVRELERWYHLTSDANPPQSTWGDGPTVLRVFTQALLLGEAPNRRWLIYAHAPLGAVPNVTVTIPGYVANYGKVTLPSVPKSGSFFLLEEADGSLPPLIVGGPDELSLGANRKYVKPALPSASC